MWCGWGWLVPGPAGEGSGVPCTPASTRKPGWGGQKGVKFPQSKCNRCCHRCWHTAPEHTGGAILPSDPLPRTLVGSGCFCRGHWVPPPRGHPKLRG